MFAATIGDIATDLRSGFASGQDVPDGVIQFRMNNVDRSGMTNWDKVRRVPREAVREDLLARPGDILFNATNSPELVGKSTLFTGLNEPVTFSNHFIRVRVKDSVAHSGYVSRWLQREFEHGRFAGMCRAWVNQASITKAQLSGLSLPLPPLDDQRRIAAILDKADALRRKRKHAIALLDSLVDNVLDHAFRDEPTNMTLGDAFTVQGGLQLTASRTHLSVKAPYLRVANVHRNRLDLAEIKLMGMTQAEFDRTALEAGDILFVEGHGNADEIGRCAVWDGSIAACSHQNHLIRARPKPDLVDPVVMSRWLNTLEGRKHLLRRGKTTSGLNTISVSDVRATPIPRLSIERSSKLRAQLDAFQTHKSIMQSQLSRLDVLFASLQHRAFSGQL